MDKNSVFPMDITKSITMPPMVSELHIAVKQNNVSKVKELINVGVDVNYPFQSIIFPSFIDGKTPLCKAVSLNHLQIVKLLLESGAFVNKLTGSGWSPLHESCYRGRSAITSILIKAGADVQLHNRTCSTPLITCAQIANVHNDVDAIQLLIDAGADVNCPNICGKIPLHFAAMYGLVKMTDVLANSSLDFTDMHGQTPLYYCIEAMNANLTKREFMQYIAVIKILLFSGCDALNLATWMHYHAIPTIHHADVELYSWYRSSLPESLKQLCRKSLMDFYGGVQKSCLKQMLSLPITLFEYLIRKLP